MNSLAIHIHSKKAMSRRRSESGSESQYFVLIHLKMHFEEESVAVLRRDESSFQIAGVFLSWRMLSRKMKFLKCLLTL